MTTQKTIYIVSDTVAETADVMVKTAISQCFGKDVVIKHFSYIQDLQDINNVMTVAKYTRCMITYTLVSPHLKKHLDQKAQDEKIATVDLMQPLIETFAETFRVEPNYNPNQMKKLNEDYFKRIEAIEFAVKYDDGQEARGFKKADIVLLGVSRTSKTPLSMYLANKKFKVANIPIIPEVPPPQELFSIPANKCIGLIIAPEHLHGIRKERLNSLGLSAPSNYTSLDRILEELDYAEYIMKKIGCPVIDVSNRAIEETADMIMDIRKKRRNFL